MLRFLTAGESHGPCLIGVIDGLPAGLSLSAEDIDLDLQRRQRGYGRSGRMKIENDRVEFLGGLHQGRTTGAPLALRIENRDWANWKDKDTPPQTIPRPGHADLAGYLKYGHRDLRVVAERASARETAMRVAIGAVAKRLLAEFGVKVGSWVESIGRVALPPLELPIEEMRTRAEASDVSCPDPETTEAMRREIDEAKARRDTVGGVFVVAVLGVPPGLGTYAQWDRRLDGRLAQAVLSIPGVKGMQFGTAFENTRIFGTQVHDDILLEGKVLRRPTNRAGGLEGGVTNGQPLILRAAMKPLSTTVAPRRSVDILTGAPALSEYQRSDVCSVPAAAVVGEAVVAWVLAEALIEKFGGDTLEEMAYHFRLGVSEVSVNE